MSAVLPEMRVRVDSARVSCEATRSASASGYVTRKRSRPLCSRARLSMRRICAGESGWPYFMSRLKPEGMIATSSSGNRRQRSKKRYPASSASSPTTTTVFFCCGSAASITAAEEPASPAMVARWLPARRAMAFRRAGVCSPAQSSAMVMDGVCCGSGRRR